MAEVILDERGPDQFESCWHQAEFSRWHAFPFCDRKEARFSEMLLWIFVFGGSQIHCAAARHNPFGEEKASYDILFVDVQF
jgi:hypothetical protein